MTNTLQLSFTSSIGTEQQAKELSLSPALVVARKRLGRMSATWRRRAKVRRAKLKQTNKKLEKAIEGKFYYVRKVWRQRERYQKEGLPPRYLEGGSEAGVIPRWWNMNNQWRLSMSEWKQLWHELYIHTGFTYKDRGLGRKESKKFWSREDYGDIKFGRRDRTKPFQLGNIEFYIPVKNVEIKERVSKGLLTPRGLFKIALYEKAPQHTRKELWAKGIGEVWVEGVMAVQSDTERSRGMLEPEMTVPIKGNTLPLYQGRLILFRA